MYANKGIEFHARGSRKASLRKITEKAKLDLECMCCAKRGGGKHFRQKTCVKACSRKNSLKNPNMNLSLPSSVCTAPTNLLRRKWQG